MEQHHRPLPDRRHRLLRRLAGAFLLAGLFAGLGGLGLAGCSREPAREAAAPEAAALEAAALPVTVAIAKYGELARTVTATGTVEPSRRVRPGTRILGRVDSVPVEEGRRVASGQLLARLESRDLEASMRQARAAVASAEAQLENARAQYERMSELEARGSATRKNLEDATAAFHMAEAGVEQARANVAAASVALGYAEVRSPFDGWVVEKGIEVGDVVQPGAPLFTIEDLDPAKVVADVPEGDARGFAPGAPVTIEVPSAGFVAEGTVARIVPAADPGSRTFRFEILQPNPDGALKSGMFARVSLDRAGAGDASRRALLVPRGAIAERGQLEGLYVVDDSGPEPRARLRWVRLAEPGGEPRGERVEVLSGLAEGERYVVDPPPGLADGSPVRLDGESAAPAGDGGER